jgi:hypothetical protein
LKKIINGDLENLDLKSPTFFLNLKEYTSFLFLKGILTFFFFYSSRDQYVKVYFWQKKIYISYIIFKFWQGKKNRFSF